MKPTVTWVLVTNGGQARILENAGPGKGLVPVKGLAFEDSHLKAQDIVTDRPGRSFSSVGHGRSAMEPKTNPVDQREAEFVRALADVLEEKRGEGAFSRLIIAAAPNALGDLRPALSEGVRKTIISELPKDLTNIPTADLGKHFDGILAV